MSAKPLTGKEILNTALNDGSAIPAMPMVVERLMELCHDPAATARDLAKVLQMDANLSSRILKRVNSSFYGLTAQIKTITHAVVILGFQEIKHMALTFPVAALFQARHRHGLDMARLWRWTLSTACIARTLSYHIGHPIPEQVFVSAILGKAGLLVMNRILGDPYREAVEPELESERMPLVEKKLYDISHVQISWIFAKQWKFPDELLDAIAYQYNPVPKSGFKREAALIYAARRLFWAQNHNDGLEPLLADFPDTVTRELSLTAEVATDALARAAGEYEEMESMLEN